MFYQYIWRLQNCEMYLSFLLSGIEINGIACSIIADLPESIVYGRAF